jgi:hypothetical protein
MASCKLQHEVKIEVENRSLTKKFKSFLRKLNLRGCVVVILTAIDPVELQPLRDFESEAAFVPHQRGNYLK